MNPAVLTLVSLLALLATPAAATPAEGLRMTVRMENSHVHEGDRAVHALVQLDALREVAAEPRPVNLALVIDRSGSMKGRKIVDARAAALEMIDLLRDGDRVAIVSYSDGVRTDVASVVLDEASRSRVKAAIQRVGASGSTNLSGGMIAGHEQVRRELDAERVNRVILISDGLANRGVTDVPTLNRLAREAAQEGIVTTTLGLGADYNEDLMTSVADHGGGNYYFVAEPEEIAGVLRGELSQMMSTVAQDVTLKLAPGDGAAVDEVFGYAWRKEDGEVVVRLGDVFAGQRRAILLRLRAPAGDGRQALGDLTLRWRDVAADGAEGTARASLAVTVTADRALVERNRDAEVEARIAEIELATSMQRAAKLLQEGKREEAQKTLQDAANTARDRSRALGAAGNDLGKGASQAADMAREMEDAPASAEEQKKAIKRYKSRSYQIQKK